MDKQLQEKLTKVFEAFNDGFAKSEQVLALFNILLDVIKNLKKDTGADISDVNTVLEAKIQAAKTEFTRRLGITNADVGNRALKSDVAKTNKVIASVRDEILDLIEEVREQIPEVPEITAEELVEKLSNLKGKGRIPLSSVDVGDALISRDQFETAIVEIGGKLTLIQERIARGYGGLGGGSEGTGSQFLSRMRDVFIGQTEPLDGQALVWSAADRKWKPGAVSGGSSGGGTWGSITGTLSAQTDLQTALNAKLTANSAITGATKTKITYDANGLVTAGTDATTSDIGEGTNLYYTNARADARITLQKGAANGLATLGSDSKIPTSQLPALAITSTFVVASQAAQLALTAQEGDVAIRSDQNKSYINNGGTAGTMADWNELLTPTDAVLSVNGLTGAVTLTTTNIAEGSNLYYTDARARGAVSAGTGISYNSTTGVITSTITQYTDALARGAVSLTTTGTGAATYNATTGVLNIPTPTAGGQTLFEAIVAPSGGDYTTVGAALTAGKTRIFVRNGTYTETTQSNSTDNVIIYGESLAAIIDINTTNWTLNGAQTVIQNVRFNISTGSLTMGGANSTVSTCYFSKTGASNYIGYFSGDNLNFSNNIINSTDTSISSVQMYFLGSQQRVTSNTFTFKMLPTTTGCVRFGSTYGTFTGNTLWANNSFTSNATLFSLYNTYATVNGNTFQGNYSNWHNGVKVENGGRGIISNNTFRQFDNSITFDTVNALAITGNKFESTTTCINGNNTNQYVTITGNTAYTSVNTFATMSGNSNYFSVVGNSAPAATNIFYNDGGGSFVTIVGNVTAATGNLIVSYATNLVVQGNTGNSLSYSPNTQTMQNTSGGSLAAGDLVVLKPTSGSVSEVTTTTTAGDKNVYGIAEATIASNARGSIRTLGIITAKVDGSVTAIAIGDYLTAGTSAGRMVKALPGQKVIAIALAAASTSTTINVYVIPPVLAPGVPVPRVTSTTSTSTLTPDVSVTDLAVLTAQAAALTVAAPVGSPVDGQELTIRIKDNGTAWGITWNAIYRASSDLTLPTTTIISKTLYAKFIYNAADTKWDFIAYLNNF